jgi:hypothetical protein
MTFKSKKDTLFSIIILGTNAFLLGITVLGILRGEMKPDEYWVLPLVLAVVGLLFWLYFGTSYELSKKNGLVYRSGPFNGKIRIDRIKEIVNGKTLWVGFKPATSRHGLIIKYDQYNEIYISPETNDRFIKKALELNPNIKITT